MIPYIAWNSIEQPCSEWLVLSTPPPPNYCQWIQPLPVGLPGSTETPPLSPFDLPKGSLVPSLLLCWPEFLTRGQAGLSYTHTPYLPLSPLPSKWRTLLALPVLSFGLAVLLLNHYSSFLANLLFLCCSMSCSPPLC